MAQKKNSAKSTIKLTDQFVHEFLPVKRGRPQDYPIMIVLHGRGDSLKPFRGLREELSLTNVNLLLLNAPRKYSTGFTWYAFPPNQGVGVKANRARLSILLEDIELQGWKSDQVILFGFSQGSLMSVDFGLNSPKKLGGIICISGYVYFFPNWKKSISSAAFQTKWLMTHGTKDSALDFNTSKYHAQRLISAGLPVRWMEFEKDHEIDLYEEARAIKKFVEEIRVQGSTDHLDSVPLT